MPDLATSAIQAVRDYEHWHQEVARLSGEIAGVICPNEDTDEIDGVIFVTGGESCFKTAAGEVIGGDTDGTVVRRSLASIAEVVAACPSCSRLCVLIAERKVAKQTRGAAKRYVRRVGKMALREVTHA